MERDYSSGASPGARPAVFYMMLALLCAAVVTLAALWFLWQRYQFVRLGYEVSRLQRAQAALVEIIEPLGVEAGYLSRLERIDALARGQLGMRPPRPSQIIILGDHGPPADQSP